MEEEIEKMTAEELKDFIRKALNQLIWNTYDNEKQRKLKHILVDIEAL